MNKIIGVTELQRNFSTVLNQVVNEHVPYILTRGSRPEAVIIPYDQYLQYVGAHEQEVHSRFDALLERMAKVNAKFTDEEVERDVEEVSDTVRVRRELRENKKTYGAHKSTSNRTRKAKK